VGHDGTEGLSSAGWLPDRVSVGELSRAFPAAVGRRGGGHDGDPRAPTAVVAGRLVVYFVLALWLFRGPNCGYAHVLGKLVDGLFHRRRGQQLLDGDLDPRGWVEAGQGRRWRPPNISSLARARARLGADPLHMLFEHVAGPTGAHDAAGVFCAGLRVVSVDGSSTDAPDTTENAGHFGRPASGSREGAFPQVVAPIAPAPGPPRRPATSPPARTNPPAPPSHDESRSTAYAPANARTLGPGWCPGRYPPGGLASQVLTVGMYVSHGCVAPRLLASVIPPTNPLALAIGSRTRRRSFPNNAMFALRSPSVRTKVSTLPHCRLADSLAARRRAFGAGG